MHLVTGAETELGLEGVSVSGGVCDAGLGVAVLRVWERERERWDSRMVESSFSGAGEKGLASWSWTGVWVWFGLVIRTDSSSSITLDVWSRLRHDHAQA